MVKEIPSGLQHVRLRAVNQADACRVSAIIDLPGKEREIFLLDVPVMGVKLALKRALKETSPEDLRKLKRESAIADAAWDAYWELESEELQRAAEALGIDLSPAKVTA